jgi:uncharacterized membrane protein YhiD involved in acid resistance
MILAVIHVVKKLKKSIGSHETDEAASSQEESAHIAAQNIENEATRNAENQSEKCNNNTEKSSSDNQSETGNVYNFLSDIWDVYLLITCRCYLQIFGQIQLSHNKIIGI